MAEIIGMYNPNINNNVEPEIPGKTIVCGHFHSSWGWSHIDQKRKEWPPKNYKNWQKSFEPYIKEGIMAIDSCCAYSGFLNCLTLEVEE